MPETVVHFQIRMPPVLHEQLASWAKEDKASLNAPDRRHSLRRPSSSTRRSRQAKNSQSGRRVEEFGFFKLFRNVETSSGSVGEAFCHSLIRLSLSSFSRDLEELPFRAGVPSARYAQCGRFPDSSIGRASGCVTARF